MLSVILHYFAVHTYFVQHFHGRVVDVPTLLECRMTIHARWFAAQSTRFRPAFEPIG